MRNICCFYDGSYYTFVWLKAMLWVMDEFRQRGYKINFLNRKEYLPVKDKADTLLRAMKKHTFDIVLIAHHHSARGEICTRDFEAFVNGAVLLKPDMSHLITYPNWFIAGETYVPLSWEFDDLEKVLEEISHKRNNYIKIAANGQKRYQKYVSTEFGKKEFVRHFNRRHFARITIRFEKGKNKFLEGIS